MNELAINERPDYGLGSVETAGSAVAAQMRALVEARYVVAIRRPRDWDQVREKMLKECRRPSFAAVARYVKPIGKDKAKWPTGPSIRFVEMAIRCMTNVTVETMAVYDDREKRILRVTLTDLEANVPYSGDVPVAKTIERRQKKDGDVVLRERTNSYGDKVYILEGTDDDILNKQAAQGSKAVRTLGLRLIPGDIVDECMELVVHVQQNADAQDPDQARRKLFDGFGSIGVGVEGIKAYLGHDGTTLSPKELQNLRELFAALRDGETTWRDVMDEQSANAAGKPAGGGGLEAVRAAAAAAAAAKKAAAGGKKPDPETGEVDPPAAAPPPHNPPLSPHTFEQYVDRLAATNDSDIAALVLDEARLLPEDQQAALAKVFEAKFGGK